MLGRAWGVRKQCWEPGLCDEKGRRVGWGHSGSGWKADSGVLAFRRESISIISFDHSGP